MSVRTIVSSSKFFNQFKNGIAFNTNPSEFTRNLTGTVLEKIKLLQEIDVEWFSKSLDSNATWTTNAPAASPGTIASNSGSFLRDGFSIDDTFDYINLEVSSSVVFTAKITGVEDKLLSFDVLTGSSGLENHTDAIIHGTNDLTYLQYSYGLIGNTETFNTISKVSQNDQTLYSSSAVGFDGGGGRSLTPVIMNPKSVYEDWITGPMTVAYLSNPTTYVQRFLITHEFMIVPWFLEGQLEDLKNLIVPELFKGDSTLKYAFKSTFRTISSDPTTNKIGIVDNNLGNVAWLNENNNGFENNYQINSIAYEDEATTVSSTGLLVEAKTKITIELQKNNGNFAAGDTVGVYISYLPPEDEYTNTIGTRLRTNFIYDNAINVVGGAGVSGGDFIKDLVIPTSVTDVVIVTIETLYSTAQQIRLASANDPNYIIGILAGDDTLSAIDIDKTMLKADATAYKKEIDIPGLINVTDFDIFTLDQTIGVDAGYSDANLWNEDNIAVRFSYNLDLSKSAVLNSMQFKLTAYNVNNNAIFELDSYDFPIAGAPIVPSPLNAQQISVSTNRGYNLILGSQYNDVIMTTGTQAGSLQNYDAQIGQKISWQDWIQNLDVDNIFFDATKPNNNLNLKSSNYSELNNYQIRLSIAANVSGVSTLGIPGTTNYLINSHTIIVFDYDKDGNETAIWLGVIQTFKNSNMHALGTGQVLSGQDTLMRITWTNSTGPVVSTDGIFAYHRIEETLQPGYNIDELDTLHSFQSPNKLIPKSGDTQLDIYLNAGNVITECLVQGSLITQLIAYNLSGRIGTQT